MSMVATFVGGKAAKMEVNKVKNIVLIEWLRI